MNVNAPSCFIAFYAAFHLAPYPLAHGLQEPLEQQNQPQDDDLLARVALGAIGVFVLVGAWMGIKRGLKRRMTAKPSVFVEELSRLARRLNVPVLADCSTAKLAAQLDQRLAQQLGAQTPEAERADGLGLVNHKNTARQPVWNVGALSAFGQRLEASSFGITPVDLHDGSQIMQSAFRRARSQRLQRWGHQIAYVVRGHWLHR